MLKDAVQLINASDLHLRTAGPQSLPWTFKVTDIAALEEVAFGAFGVVYRGRCPGKTSDVAIKIAKAMRIDKQDLAERRLRDEITLLAKMQHEGVITFMGELECSEGSGLMMAWADGGEVLGYVARGDGKKRKELLVDVARALAYIHSLTPPVSHGDIHPRNVLVCGGRAVLVDFGLSIVGSNTEITGSTVSGRADYLAPELWMGTGGKTSATDVYAWGILSAELYSGTPWIDTRHVGVCIKKIVVQMARPRRPDHMEDEVWQTAQRCWAHDASDRPPADGVCALLEG